MTAEQVEVRGGSLAVEDEGEGRAFVWGHGLTSSRADERRTGFMGSWTFPEGGVRLIRYDARGHGESPGTAEPARYRWDELAHDQLALANALGIDHYVAGGASMGCATALHAAVAAPGRIEALVLAIPPTAWATRPDQRALYEAGAQVIERDGLAVFADLGAAMPPPAVFADLGLDWPSISRERTLALDADILPSILRGAAASDLPPEEAVAGLTMPALVLAWEGDPTHPASTAHRLGEVLPHADIFVASDLADVLTWPERVRAFVAAP